MDSAIYNYFSLRIPGPQIKGSLMACITQMTRVSNRHVLNRPPRCPSLFPKSRLAGDSALLQKGGPMDAL